MECKRISVKETAKILGVDEQKIRVQLREGKGLFSKLGYACKSSTGKTWQYFIYEYTVEAFMRREVTY